MDAQNKTLEEALFFLFTAVPLLIIIESNTRTTEKAQNNLVLTSLKISLVTHSLFPMPYLASYNCIVRNV